MPAGDATTRSTSQKEENVNHQHLNDYNHFSAKSRVTFFLTCNFEKLVLYVLLMFLKKGFKLTG